MKISSSGGFFGLWILQTHAFLPCNIQRSQSRNISPKVFLQQEKERLLGLLTTQRGEDPILADPITRQPLIIQTKSKAIIAGAPKSDEPMLIVSTNNTFGGSTLSYYDLLDPLTQQETTTLDANDVTESIRKDIQRNLIPFVPPPLRGFLPSADGDSYVPMRDLFTSPAVSFAYERGWRQGFQQAGFPGPDQEARMAMEYFQPSIQSSEDKVIVDMSCATGLFTRRFAKSGNYKRVLGCDYSESMLQEARRRIQADSELRNLSPGRTRLELIRLDVGQIPMKNNSIDALHAGAAMHCWPDLPTAVSEIHRVLKPGGRAFFTTFLSSYFATLRTLNNGNGGSSFNEPSKQAFQYFESVDVLRKLLMDGGFEHEKLVIEVLGSACVVIRCEK